MRRTGCLLLTLAALVSTPGLRGWQPPASSIFAVDKIAERLYLLSTKSEGGENGEALGNVVFYVSNEGVLVVDDQFDKERRSGETVNVASGILDQIRKI